jgi:hypothetical protein
MRSDFLGDPHIRLTGYQCHFEKLTLGLFLFTHSCGGTLSLPAEKFLDLHRGPIYQQRLTGTKDCPGYCLRDCELRPCPNACECAYIRNILDILNNFEKLDASDN